MNSNSIEIENLTEISELISEAPSQEVLGFLSEILTPAEISTLAKRWQILKMLNQGISQRIIAKELNVSLCKVTRGARILKDLNSISQKLIKGVYDEHR